LTTGTEKTVITSACGVNTGNTVTGLTGINKQITPIHRIGVIFISLTVGITEQLAKLNTSQAVYSNCAPLFCQCD